MKNKLKEIRLSKGMTLQDVAEKIGSSHQQVLRLESGQRKLSTDWLEKLACALGCTISELLGEAVTPIPGSLRQVQVIGHVQAGLWREAVEWNVDDRFPVYMPPDPRYPGITPFGLQVRGQSMNLVYPEGTILICAPLYELDRYPASGEKVIVERRRAGEVEATVKEFVAENDQCWLWPRSTRPEYQAPLPVPCNGNGTCFTAQQDEETSIEITALVIGSYRLE